MRIGELRDADAKLVEIALTPRPASGLAQR